MTRIKTRLNKLNSKIKPAAPVFVLTGKQELTEDQELQAARAAAAGQQAIIINVVAASEWRQENDN